MTLAEEVNRMIETVLRNATFTSASDNKAGTITNELIEIGQVDAPDLEAQIEDIIKDKDSPDEKKTGEVIKESKTKIKTFEDGQVGEIQRMLPAQFGNVKAFAANPSSFLFTAFFKKFAKGAGVLLLVTVIFEAVKLIIEELLKPGRLLDIRFKREIGKEIIAFRQREEKQRLRQGFSRVIVTSSPTIRGGQGVVFDSFRELQAGNPVFQNDTFMTEGPKGTPLSKSKYGRTGRFGRR